MLGTLSDPQKLLRAGFTATVSGHLANPALTDASVGIADAHVGVCLKFVSELFRARCSMLWHTSSYPGLLAPLIMDGEVVVVEHTQRLKVTCRSLRSGLLAEACSCDLHG